MKRFFSKLLLPVLFGPLLSCSSGRVVLQRQNAPAPAVLGYFALHISVRAPGEPIYGIFYDVNKDDARLRYYRRRYAKLMDDLYSLISRTLQDSLHLRLLPVDALRGKVRYHPAGYPIGNVKRLAATGAYASVLGVRIEIDPFSGHSSITTLGKTTYKLYPALTLALELYDSTGRLLWRDKQKADSYFPHVLEEPVVFEEYLASAKFHQAARKLAQQALRRILAR